jgi:hypothetical protein
MEKLWELPWPSANIDPPRVGMSDDGNWAIRYRESSRDDRWQELRFVNVGYLSVDRAELVDDGVLEAYDALVEVDGSHLREQFRQRSGTQVELNHYRIYFDDFGVIDVLANGFIPPAG